MPATSRRRLRLGLVVAAAIASGMVAGPAVAADADAHPVVLLQDQARTARPVSIAVLDAAVAGRVPTRLSGWARSPVSIRAQHRLLVPVRVSGGRRFVRLERRIAGRWRLLDRERTSAAGRATLTWRPRTTRTHVVLRVRVPATATHAAKTSRTHRVRVVRTTAPAPSAMPSARPTTAPVATPAPVATVSADEALRARLLVLVNQARSTARTCGSAAYPAAPALVRSTALDRAAGDYAAKMAAEDFFAHESPDGSTMGSRLAAVGVRGTTLRENIAAGYDTAEQVVEGWVQSPGHCANLMSADVTRLGSGHATTTTAKYGSYWVQDFAG